MAVLFVLLLPISVYAGAMGTFLNNIFKSNSNSQIPQNKTVQNMSLLVAIATPLSEETPANGNIIEDVALEPDQGPGGSSAEILKHKPTSDQISVYVVHKGDTLSQIAEMFDVTVNTIKWGNDLSSNTLREGMTLVILPISGVKHTVVKGDTVASLAKKYKGSEEEILAYNNLSKENSLSVGDVIIIPDGEVIPAPSSGSSSVRIGSSSSLKEYVGYYLRPIVGGRKSQGIHGYNAVDLAAPIGTPILASADGEVIISRSGGWNGGYGNYVVIKHPNGTQTLYAHTSSNNVSQGDIVKQGDVIASVGKTGKATGAHLHFEIRGAKNPF